MADKPLIQRSFGLTDDAYRDLKGSALACTVTNLSLMIPFVVTVAAFGCILDALTGRPLDANALWWLCGAGAVGLVAVFLAARHDYRKTYLSAYTQSERVRLDLADHLRKLPMSFFNRRDTTDVADRIMFMDGGVVVEEGPAKQLIEHPQEERTKQFLSHYGE